MGFSANSDVTESYKENEKPKLDYKENSYVF